MRETSERAAAADLEGLADAAQVAQSLRNDIAGFSPNMRDVLEKFDFDNSIFEARRAGLLFQVVQRFGDPKVDLHPDAVDNAAMGTIFEELIRKFNEALDENPGEHLTRRDVVQLMVELLLAGDRRLLRTKGVVLSVYDPCWGSGGMLVLDDLEFRKNAFTSKRAEARIEAAVLVDFERYLTVEDILGLPRPGGTGRGRTLSGAARWHRGGSRGRRPAVTGGWATSPCPTWWSCSRNGASRYSPCRSTPWAASPPGRGGRDCRPSPSSS